MEPARANVESIVSILLPFTFALEEQKADIKSGSYIYKPPLTAVPADSRGKIAILPYTGREVTITASALLLKDIK